MIKPDKNFNMSRASKTKIALMCKTPADRSFFKASMIQAELSEVAARKQAMKSKGAKGKDGE